MSGIQSTVSPAAQLIPKSLVNGSSAGATPAAGLISTTDNTKQILSGALTAATLATVLSVSGPGAIELCYLRGVDATARTLRLQIILDGVTVFDATTGSISSASSAIIAIGGLGSKGNDSLYPILPVPPRFFNASLTIKVASSLSETDKLTTQVSYWTC